MRPMPSLVKGFLERVVMPYHLDYPVALDSLYNLKEGVRDLRFLVPGHGPVVKGARAEALIENNIKVLEELPERRP